MYSIVRFTPDLLSQQSLRELATELESSVPDANCRFRKAGDGFSCQLAGDGTWELHVEAILSFLERASDTISRAVEHAVTVCVDVAVEPEDYEGISFGGVVIEPKLSKSLADAGVTFEVSIY